MTSGINGDRLEILIEQIGRLTEAVTQSRIEGNEYLERLTETMTQSRIEGNERLDRLTEAITQSHTEMNQRFDRLTEVSARQAATAERQEQNISRLVNVVEALIPRP
jgi:predicted transcriptional regulator